MTYNFDPDKWYEDQLLLIQSQLKSGNLSRVQYDQAVEALDSQLELMWQRLDGTYELPPGGLN